MEISFFVVSCTVILSRTWKSRRDCTRNSEMSEKLYEIISWALSLVCLLWSEIRMVMKILFLGFRYIRRWNFWFESTTGCDYFDYRYVWTRQLFLGRKSWTTSYPMRSSCFEIVKKTGPMSWRFYMLALVLVRASVWWWRRREGECRGMSR